MDEKRVPTTKNRICVLLGVLLLFSVLYAKDPGYEAFSRGDYEKADYYYRQRGEKTNKNKQARLNFNSGSTAFALQDIPRAKSKLTQSLSSEDKRQRSLAHYNLGQIALSENETETALDHFRKSMLNDPENLDSKIMFEKILAQQAQQEQKQDSQNSENNDNESAQNDRKNDSDSQESQDPSSQKDDPSDDKQKDENQEESKDQRSDEQKDSQNKSDKEYSAVEMDKKKAENFLDPMKEKEKESMKKLILSRANRKKVKLGRDW